MMEYITGDIISYNTPLLESFISTIVFGIGLYKIVLAKAIEFYISSSIPLQKLKTIITIIFSFLFFIISTIPMPEYCIELTTKILGINESPYAHIYPAIYIISRLLHYAITALIEVLLSLLSIFVYSKAQ